MNRLKYLDPLIRLLQIISISTQSEYLPEMQRARDFLVDLFKSLGFKTRILKGKKHGAVFAELETNDQAPTVLIYGHYDVQPPDPLDEWKSDPFEPTIMNGKIYGRGTTDNKGQLMLQIMSIKKLLAENKKLKVNFKFLIEGEEEIGSISIEAFAKEYADTFLKCDYIIVSDSEMLSGSTPTIDISLRGLLYTEVFLQSAVHDVHSGQYGGVAENPANILAQIISKLKDEKNKILIPHFYDDVIPLTKREIADYKSIGMTGRDIKYEGELFGVGGGEEEFSLNERRWGRPTLDVNGLTSGYQEEGSKTIIPAKSSAKISMRLVPNQNPDKIFTSFSKYIKSLIPEYVKLKIAKHASDLPYKAPTDSFIFDIMKKLLKKSFGKDTVFTGVGGSIGFVPIMAKALNVPVLMVGFGLPADNLHAPNESFTLDNYYKGIKVMTDFYKKLDLTNKGGV